jgi:catechol-2,3-dioxygenase
MKRLHIHLGVNDLDNSIGFYTALFGVEPTKVKADYAKWMLEDPRINFAISTRTNTSGVDHLGIQVDSAEELTAMRAHLASAQLTTRDDGATVCCYAESDKSWVQDPNGMPWEVYQTMADAQTYTAKTEPVMALPMNKRPKQAACGVNAGSATACC